MHNCKIVFIFTFYFQLYLILYFLICIYSFLGDCFSNIFLTPIEVGVNLKNGYNGDISAKEAGRIGGNMVKKMIQKAESQMLSK